MIGPWQFALIALTAWRTFHLLAWDSILDRTRAALFDEKTSMGRLLDAFVSCVFCLGFWVALAWVAAFWITPHWTLVVAVPFAVSAAVAGVQIVADALTD